MTLTLSGTQENFSEIIKGTPSMAAKEERGNGVVDTTSIYEFRRRQAQRRRAGGRGPPTCTQVVPGGACARGPALFPGHMPPRGRQTLHTCWPLAVQAKAAGAEAARRQPSGAGLPPARGGSRRGAARRTEVRAG